MICTLKAILARNDGDLNQAIDYCIDIAVTYPRLSNEYWNHFQYFWSLIPNEKTF